MVQVGVALPAPPQFSLTRRPVNSVQPNKLNPENAQNTHLGERWRLDLGLCLRFLALVIGLAAMRRWLVLKCSNIVTCEVPQGSDLPIWDAGHCTAWWISVVMLQYIGSPIILLKDVCGDSFCWKSIRLHLWSYFGPVVTVEPSLKGSVRVQICWHCSTLLQCHCLHLLRAGLKPTLAIWHPKDHNGQEKQQGMRVEPCRLILFSTSFTFWQGL